MNCWRPRVWDFCTLQQQLKVVEDVLSKFPCQFLVCLSVTPVSCCLSFLSLHVKVVDRRTQSRHCQRKTTAATDLRSIHCRLIRCLKMLKLKSLYFCTMCLVLFTTKLHYYCLLICVSTICKGMLNQWSPVFFCTTDCFNARQYLQGLTSKGWQINTTE